MVSFVIIVAFELDLEVIKVGKRKKKLSSKGYLFCLLNNPSILGVCSCHISQQAYCYCDDSILSEMTLPSWLQIMI